MGAGSRQSAVVRPRPELANPRLRLPTADCRSPKKEAPENRGSFVSQTTSLRVSASAGFSYHLGSMRQVTPFSRRVASYSLRMKGSSIQ